MARPRKAPAPKTTPAEAERTGVIYARVSTEEQAAEGYSLDAQLGALRAYAARERIRIVGEYVESETAKSSGRKEFGKMLARVQAERIGCIVAEKVDRLYRNLPDYVKVDDLKGVEVHMVKEGEVYGDGDGSDARFMHGIKVLIARKYSENLSEETCKGMAEKARQGVWPTMAPVGYRNVEVERRKLIEPDPDTAQLVARLFEAYAGGEASVRRVAAWCQTIGLRNRAGGRLASSQVYAVLRNPLYCGIVRWGGEDHAGVHEPIVSRAVYDRCQRIMEGRSDGAVGGGHARAEYAYRGLVRCGVCGCAASPYTSKGTYVYYACTGARGCPRIGVREEAITEAVARVLEGLRIRPSVLGVLRDAVREGHADVLRQRGETEALLARRRGEAEARLEALYRDRVAGDVPESAYRKLRGEWEGDLAAVETEIRALGPAHRATWDDSLAMLDAVSNSADRFREASPERRREMFRSLVSDSQLLDGKVAINLRPWFKSVVELNGRGGLNPAIETRLQDWLPAMDSNHD